MKYVKKYWQIIFPILIMLLIWSFSAQNGDDSDGVSLALAAKLGLSNGVVRKIAHFIIYAMLGASLANFFRSINQKKFPNIKDIVLSLLIAFIYSCIDEYHQSLIPGRDGNRVDIIIDSLGACAGISAYVSAYFFYLANRKAKKNKK